jgi:nucleotide-binding universal stress UspA family protein
MSACKKILVPVDFSAQSNEALDCAVELARVFGAEIHVVHAFDLPVPLVSPREVAVPNKLFDQAWQSATDQLRKATDKVAAAGIDSVPHLLEVPTAQAIVDLAESIEADLIVMGTRGHTGLKHILLGSVAERTLRLAPCSVLVVRGDEGPH